ncbi:MAG: exosortase/archaeosortase family protein [Candidatus Aureabacteria bacterium]|nr:exosortase/archaeosortase family protein [Candidatus Auribacterota bacterium]
MKDNKVKLLIIGILLCIIYWPTFLWMKERFEWAGSYYSHGFIVPFIVAFLVWKKKEVFIGSVKPADAGLTMLIISLFIHVISYAWKIYFISGFSMIFTLAGLIVYLFGFRALKELWFPLSFLIFMIPLPILVIDNVSFKLKIFVAQVATHIINLLGIQAERQGSEVILQNTSLMIGSPCSGLRSLISLTALGSLYAYLVNLTNTRKMILFISSIPLALLSNIIRVVLLLWVARGWGSEAATGWFHDFSGLLVFVFAFLGLKITDNILSWKTETQNT